MPDITGELYSIKTNELGGDVLTSIYNALIKIDNFIGPVELDESEVQRVAELMGVFEIGVEYSDIESYNITEELNTIKNSRYGSEIRMAIHDALDKLNELAENQKPPTPPAPKTTVIVGSAIPSFALGGSTIIGYAETEE